MFVHFWYFYAGRYIADFVTKSSRDKGAQTKSGNGAIGYRRI